MTPGTSLRASTVLGAALSAALLASAPAVASPGSASTEGADRVEKRGPAASDADPLVAALRGDLDWILRATGWRSTEWGVLAVSLDSGDTLFAHAPETPLTPASNVKLLTTAAALHHLGPDFRWETYVLSDGGVVDGTLLGDLVLYGTGDPGLSERFEASSAAAFEGLASRLGESGVRRIHGDVVGDGSFFQGPLTHPDWDPADLNDWFAAPVGALSFNENVVTLRIESGPHDGAPPRVHTLPADPGLPIENLAVTGRGRLMIQRDHPLEPIRIVGSIPRGGRDVWRRITVRDPARTAAQALRTALEDAGIEVMGRVRTAASAYDSPLTGRRIWAPGAGAHAPRLLARHRSPALREYVAVVNKESHNLFAEAMLKTLGRVVDGEGSFQGGVRVVERFVRDHLGPAASGAVLTDGSGLADSNRVGAATFVALLRYMAASPEWAPYWESLPEAGNRRELGRMYRTAAAGNLRAKTGTIRGVSALSGIVRSVGGERIAFSIIGNRVPSTWSAKRVEDRIGIRLAAFDRPLPTDAILATEAVPDPSSAPDATTEGSDRSAVARRR